MSLMLLTLAGGQSLRQTTAQENTYIGVPDKTHLDRASSLHAASEALVFALRIVWPSSRTMRRQFILAKAASEVIVP